jgi:hypothetical protein
VISRRPAFDFGSLKRTPCALVCSSCSAVNCGSGSGVGAASACCWAAASPVKSCNSLAATSFRYRVRFGSGLVRAYLLVQWPSVNVSRLINKQLRIAAVAACSCTTLLTSVGQLFRRTVRIVFNPALAAVVFPRLANPTIGVRGARYLLNG